ncbi:PAAR domain-containing protein [Herbaspirillum sp. DW155]|uniref:PAAR domain-containing protein n=1 Tax=Herbaspirillum sp. DW155 TaxID=3095609 RepID=UPI00308CA4F8|nr:PAAR domain-containing protein [Herbaspirillum sp. DW155]
MSRPFITIGDKTSHGGTVISGDQTFLIHGKAVAGIGDLTFCPRCKGTFPITTGAEDMITNGKAPAREGDRTACGAVLMATQAVTTHSIEQDAGTAANASAAASTVTNALPPADSGICLSCLMNAAKSGATMIVRD